MSLAGHLRELGLEAIRRGVTTFKFDPMVYADEKMLRKGFSVRDELDAFCWLSRSTYMVDKNKMICVVRVPEFAFWDYWLDRLSSTMAMADDY